MVHNRVDGGHAADDAQIGAVAEYSGTMPWAVAVTLDGKRAYVVNTSSNTVSVIDVASNTQTGVVSSFTRIWPVRATFTPNGTSAYVVNPASASVPIIRVRGATTLWKSDTAPASGATLLMPFGRYGR
ncbi:YncE family protein [Burkholderia sp. TSV86]|uniref:YncE family protein n=1 Tax=Burkholderia sp. TSV86 TaxID=1385594 RepID=UPI0009E9539B|nr:hypothetical protein [Burkholderia sp. TSV86]